MIHTQHDQQSDGVVYIDKLLSIKTTALLVSGFVLLVIVLYIGSKQQGIPLNKIGLRTKGRGLLEWIYYYYFFSDQQTVTGYDPILGSFSPPLRFLVHCSSIMIVWALFSFIVQSLPDIMMISFFQMGMITIFIYCTGSWFLYLFYFLLGVSQPGAREAHVKAQSFVNILMSTSYEDIPNSKGIKILRNIAELETGVNFSIIVRSDTEQFWTACVETVNTPNKRLRVAAVGTPGIGKTSTTPILIRMLLEQMKTVVYLLRTKKNNGWYYEFTPQSGGTVIAKVYPESYDEKSIDSLRERETYYIVDPGQTKDDCNPPADFLPKVILVTSPDENHWGKSEFSKERQVVRGYFKVYPIWSVEDLLAVRQVFGNFTEDNILERYRLFGGVPRRVFTADVQVNLEEQNFAISNISVDQVKNIALGQMDAIGDFGINAPKGILITFHPSNKTDFSRGSGADLLSPLIREKVYSRHMRDLWETMINAGEIIGRTLLEPYVRTLLTKDRTLSLECRTVKSGLKGKSAVRTIQCCTKIRLVADPAASLNNVERCTLLHASNPRHPLFDCIFKDNKNQIHAIQITTGKQHSINVKCMKELYQKIIPRSKIKLYYFVPSNNFAKFQTTPVKPNYDTKQFEVFIASIPNPNDELRMMT